MENLLNAIFVPKCIFCQTLGNTFCYNCLQKCRIITRGLCILCEKPSVNGVTHQLCLRHNPKLPSSVFSCFEYEGLVRDCIKKSKYGPRFFSAMKRLTYEGVKYASKFGQDYLGFTVVPIPINSQKYKERGFNQAEIVAQIVSKEFGLKMDSSILNRIKNTKVQYESSREVRFENLKGAFTADKNKTKNSKILLVDDICTTGATLTEAAETLYTHGALEVKCFALAKRLKLRKPTSSFTKKTYNI